MKRYGPDSISSWFAALESVFISMVLYGVVRMSSVLFVASMQRFDVDRQSASMPYILTDFVQALSSPLTGYLTHKFGVRRVMAFGCLLSAIGIGACFFAEEIGTVTIFWGVIFGLGFGLSVPLLAVVVTQHFINKRAIAIGVVYFGGYFGYSTLPSVVQYLIDYYGLSGAFLYISGIMLNCVPLAMLLRKPNFPTIKSRTDDPKVRTSYEMNLVPKKADDCDPYRTIIENDACKAEFQTHESESTGKINNGFEPETNSGNGAKNIKETSKSSKRNNLSEVSYKSVVKYPNQVHCQPTNFNKIKISEEHSQKCENHSDTPKTFETDANTVDKDESASVHIKSNSKDDTVPTTIESKSVTPSLRAFRVFLEPIFIVILITEAVFEGSFIAFVTIIVDFSLDVGLPLTYGKYVILSFSVASAIGLLGFGWVTDDGHMTLTNFSSLLFVLRCVTTAVIPFSNGLVFLLAAVFFHGLCESPLSNLFPLIIADYFAKEVHEVAISCRLFLCAPVYLVTPTLIGYFRDYLGSYLYLFYLISLCSLISGILLFLSPQLAKLRCGRARDERILRNKNL